MIVLYAGQRVDGFVMDYERSKISDYKSFVEIDEISANKAAIKDIIFSQPDFAAYSVQAGQLYKDGVLVAIVIDSDKAQIRAEYQNMITRLDQIQNPVTPPPFTQAGFNQVLQAVKDLALYETRLMKAVKQIAPNF